MNRDMIFEHGDTVTIHSLGESTPGTFRGKICGIAVNWAKVREERKKAA